MLLSVSAATFFNFYSRRLFDSQFRLKTCDLPDRLPRKQQSPAVKGYFVFRALVHFLFFADLL